MHIKTISDNTYFVRISKDEAVVAYLTAFFEKEHINFGYLTAIGALTDPTIAYYNTETKEYQWKEFLGTYEVVSMTGNVALVDNKPFLHAHLVLSDHEYKTFGGHLKEGLGGGTLEVMVERYEGSVAREFDDETGLKLLTLD